MRLQWKTLERGVDYAKDDVGQEFLRIATTAGNKKSRYVKIDKIGRSLRSVR